MSRGVSAWRAPPSGLCTFPVPSRPPSAQPVAEKGRATVTRATLVRVTRTSSLSATVVTYLCVSAVSAELVEHEGIEETHVASHLLHAS